MGAADLLRLQVELQAYVILRFKAGTLGKITADELRNAAFDTHPKAYTEGGLTMVALLSPALIPVIATIPRVEFKPSSPTFKATVKQVLDTSGIVVPQVIGMLLAAAAGPAHNQMLSVASARDLEAFQADRLASLRLAEVRSLVRHGRCDHLDVLARLRIALEDTTFLDLSADQVAASVVDEIERRMVYVNQRYQRESQRDMELRDIFQEFDEDACTWRP